MRDKEKLFQECLKRGIKYIKEHPNISFKSFLTEMFRYFGDNNLDLIAKIWNRIIVDIPIIELFGFDVKIFKEKMKPLTSVKLINILFEGWDRNIDDLLESFSKYRVSYDEKRSFVYNENLDYDYLEEQGMESWGEYYTADIKDATLKEIIIHLFHRTDNEYMNEDDTMDLASKVIPEECYDYKNKITQCYLLKLGKVKPASTDTTEKFSIIGKQVDIVRIFEAMSEVGIISSKTEIKQIAKLFFTDPVDITSFEKNYNATAHRLKDQASLSTSKNLNHFIKSLSERLRQQDVDDLIRHLEKLKPIR